MNLKKIYRSSLNKKVLLREHKRHTDCGVSSTPSVVLYRGGTPSLLGVPQPGLTGRGTWSGVPTGRGTSTPRSDWGGTQGGIPPPLGWTWPGYPSGWTWPGYPSPLAGPGWGTPLAGPGWGTHSPVDRQMDGWTDTCQNITFPSYYVRGG